MGSWQRDQQAVFGLPGGLLPLARCTAKQQQLHEQQPAGLSHKRLKTWFTIRYIPGVIAGDAFQTFFEGGRGKPPFFMPAGRPIKNAPGAAQSVTSTFDRLVTADWVGLKAPLFSCGRCSQSFGIVHQIVLLKAQKGSCRRGATPQTPELQGQTDHSHPCRLRGEPPCQPLRSEPLSQQIYGLIPIQEAASFSGEKCLDTKRDPRDRP